MGKCGIRDLKTDVGHPLAKQIAVLCHGDGLPRRRDHLDAECVDNPLARQIERTVQAGLATHRRQQRIGPLLGDDAGECLPVHRLYVYGIGGVRIGHDRGGIRVDENDPIALFLERLAGLRARVIELAGLPDHDRPGADNQYGLYIVSLRHWLRDTPAGSGLEVTDDAGRASFIAAMKRANNGLTSCGPGLASGCPWKPKAGASVCARP